MKTVLSNIKYQISNIKYQISNIKYQISNIKYQISNIKYQQVKQVIMNSQGKLPKVTFYTLVSSIGLISYFPTYATDSFSFHSINTEQTTNNSENKPNNTILVIDIAPALCKLSKDYTKFRQCADGKNYVIRSLVFLNKKTCNAQSVPELLPVPKMTLQQFMPDKKMQIQAWQHHGACSGLSDSEYFRPIIERGKKLSLDNKLNGTTYQITQKQLRKNILNDNKQLASKELQFLCHTQQDKEKGIKTQLLTQIRICDNNNQCSKTPIDKADKYAKYTTKCTEPLLTIVKP